MPLSKEPIKVLDCGFVRLVDTMGDDEAIVDAARVSYANHNSDEARPEKSTRRLIRYLMRNWHTSPIEQVEIKLHFKAPIMVARQILRHRTAAPNEVSGRYTILSGEFYIPAPEQICYQSDDNKQGRSGPLPLEEALQWQDKLLNECDKAYAAYTEAADRGMAKETARMMLPVNVYTEWYWKIDGHNLLHFLRLRLHEHAQWETRQYGEAIASIVKQWIPLTWEAFEDYRLYSYTLSRMEKEVVSSLISSIPEIELRKLLRENGCVKSEIDEFIKAMGQDTK